MNDPPNVWFDCLQQDELFPDYKTSFALKHNFDHVTYHLIRIR